MNNNYLEKTEKLLKRCVKRKVSLNSSTVVVFLITGLFMMTGENLFAGYNNDRFSGTNPLGNWNASFIDNAGKGTTGDGNFAAGYSAGTNVTGEANTAIGNGAGQNVSGRNNFSAGRNTGHRIIGESNVSLGENSGTDISGDQNFSAGYASGTGSTGWHNIAIGNGSGQNVGNNGSRNPGNVSSNQTTGMGRNNVAIGRLAGNNVEGNENVAIGGRVGRSVGSAATSSATGIYNVAIGSDSGNNVQGRGNVAMGELAGNFIEGSHNIVMGNKAGAGLYGGASTITRNSDLEITGTSGTIIPVNDTISLGTESLASKDKVTAVGYKAEATKDNTLALGGNAKADVENSVALGDNSTTIGTAGATTKAKDSTYTGATINGLGLSFAGGNSVAGVVSVGNENATRRIQNVAPGLLSATSTDAVNGSQLYALASEVSSLTATSAPHTYFHVNTGGNTGGDATTNLGAIDKAAAADGYQSLTAGVEAKVVNTSGGIAIGSAANVRTNNTGTRDRASVAIGYKATIDGGISSINSRSSTAIGTNAIAGRLFDNAGTALNDTDSRYKTITGGTDATNSQNEKNVMWLAGLKGDPNSNSNGTNDATAIGAESRAIGDQSIAIGGQVIAGNASVAIGGNDMASVTGNNAKTNGKKNTEIYEEIVGAELAANTEKNSAGQDVFWATTSAMKGSVAIGQKAYSRTLMGTAIGLSAFVNENAELGTAIGAGARVGESKTDGTGKSTKGGVAIAAGAVAESDYTTAIGTGSKALAEGATGIGYKNTVNGANATAIGRENTIANTGTKSVALGSNINVTTADSVVLGSDSDGSAQATKETEGVITYSYKDSTGATKLDTLKYGTFVGAPPVDSAGNLRAGYYVSVGSSGAERQIKHVAAGAVNATSTDAINGSQLYATNQVVGNVAGSVKNVIGGAGTVLKQDGTISAPNIAGTGKGNISDAIIAARTKVTAGTNVVSVNEVDDKNTGRITYKIDAEKTTVSAATGSGLTVTSGTRDPQTNVTNYEIGFDKTTQDKIDAVTNKGITFTGDNNTTTGVKKLGDTVAITGDNYIKTKATTAGIELSLSQDLVNKIDSATKTNSVRETVVAGDSGNVSVTKSRNLNNTGGEEFIVDIKNQITLGSDGTDGKTPDDGSITVNGKDGSSVAINGKDGSISATGKDGAGVAINGSDGSISLTGKDGANGLSIKGDAGPAGVDGVDGETKTRVVYERTNPDGTTTTEEIATLNDGLKFTGNNSDTVNRHKLNTTVKVVGERTDNKTSYVIGESAANNIIVEANGTDTLTVKMSKDLDLTDKGSVKMGDTTVNNNGLTINDGPSVTKDGVDAGGKKITNVAAGEDPTDAVNVSQLKQHTTNINNNFNAIDKRINKLDDKVDRGLAGAAAMAGLEFMDIGVNQATVAAAVGGYKGTQAVAVGLEAAPTENTRVNAKVSMTPGSNVESLYSIGAAYRFNWK